MSYGSLGSRGSGATLPVRISVYVNGSSYDDDVGRRVVLDRTDSLQENIMRVAKKLRMERSCTEPLLYTQQGILVEETEEIIEGEVLLFEPHGKPYLAFKTSQTSRKEESNSKNEDTGGINAKKYPSSPKIGSTSCLERRNSIEFDYMFKFILVGNIAVGKSCILLRVTDKRFETVHETTIGVDFGTETIHIGRGADERAVKIQIWDTAGQEDFQAITRAYYREAAAALVVYDISNRDSFEEVRTWIRNVRQSSTNRALTIALIGNKVDLDESGPGSDAYVTNSARVVTREEGETFARENGLLFFETSAKTGQQVQAAFTATANAVMRKVDLGLVDLDNPSQGVRLGTSKKAKEILAKKGKMSNSETNNQPIILNKRNARNLVDGDDESACYCW